MATKLYPTAEQEPRFNATIDGLVEISVFLPDLANVGQLFKLGDTVRA